MTHKTKKIINAVIYALLIVISTVVMTQSRGMLRTLPLVLVLPAVATFFVNRKLITIFLCFAATLCVGFAENESVNSAIFTAVASAAFASAGILVKRLLVTAHIAGDKRKLLVFPGVLLFAAGLVLYFAVFGNPVSHFLARNDNISYIEGQYGDNAPEIRHTYYDFSRKDYFTNVAFSDETYMNADISAAGDYVYDGYSNYYEYKLLSARRNEIAKLLNGYFADGRFALRINQSESDISASVRDMENPQQFYGKMVFDLAFYDQLLERDAFVRECVGCAEYLKQSGIEFASFNFYGGFADEFLYEMSVPCGFAGNYSSIVADFSGQTFDRYYDESDYADGWYYGK